MTVRELIAALTALGSEHCDTQVVLNLGIDTAETFFLTTQVVGDAGDAEHAVRHYVVLGE